MAEIAIAKDTAENIMKGSILFKVVEFKYFLIFTSFLLSLDIYISYASNINILNLNILMSETLPLGHLFCFLSGFSLLFSFIGPALFYIFSNMVWTFWYSSFFEILRPNNLNHIDYNHSRKNLIYIEDLKSWAVINDNSLAMNLVNKYETKYEEMRIYRIHSFLLSLCLYVDYFHANGLLYFVEKNYFNDNHAFYVFVVVSSIITFLGISLNSYSENYGYIYLSKIKEKIETQLSAKDTK